MAAHGESVRARDPAIRALSQELIEASGAQILRVVATVDAMVSRGAADQLVAPLRQRLIALRPPRPLRFVRLLFHPLDPLIVPAARWRFGQHSVPRTALAPMADHVRQTMGATATAMEAAIAGHTDAEAELIARLGRSLWPVAAAILAEPAMPAGWDATQLGVPVYRPLADVIATLLGQATALDALCVETANGLLPPGAEAIDLILTRVATAHPAALPMAIALLLARLPQAAAQVARSSVGPAGAVMAAALDQAAGLLLRQLEEADGIEVRIATGSLAESGGAVKGIATLLRLLDSGNAQPRRRDTLRAVRDRLDAGCKVRFAAALEDDLLMPLRHLGASPGSATISALETAARGLRVLETEARTVGSGATYDLLLGTAAAAIENGATREVLTLADRLRLVEILAGTDAALAVLCLRFDAERKAKGTIEAPRSVAREVVNACSGLEHAVHEPPEAVGEDSSRFQADLLACGSDATLT